jgi:hypothetical protein
MRAAKFKNPPFLFNLLLMIIFLVLAVVARDFSDRARIYPQLVLWIGISILGIWLSVYLFFPTLMRFLEAQAELDEEEMGQSGPLYRAWGCILGSVVLGCLLGFLWAVPTAILSYGLLLGERAKLKIQVVYAATLTALFYVAFHVVLSLPVLTGILLDLD